MWPFPRRERRAYTDQVLEALLDFHTGETVDAARTGAVRAVSGLLSRAFASAAVTPANTNTAPLTPSVLAYIGRELVECGRSVWMLDVRDGQLMLKHVDSYERTGDRYRCTMGEVSMTIPAEQLLHVQWAGCDLPPWASDTANTLGGIERTLEQEAGNRSGYLLPLPGDPADNPKLKDSLKNRKGNLIAVRTQAGGMGDRTEAIRDEWRVRRVGQDPPEQLLRLRQAAEYSVYAACGLPPALFSPDATDGVLREGQRQALHAFIEPAPRFVEDEASAKLDVELRLDFDALRAADLRGRSQAIKALVEAGVPLDEALRRAGLD